MTKDLLKLISSGDQIVKVAASQRVADRLLALVQSGNLKAGDKLPTESELGDAFDVSRPVIREALRGLSIMGVVEGRQGGGHYLTDLSASRLTRSMQFVLKLDEHTVEQLAEARICVEREMVGQCVDKISQDDLEKLKRYADLGPRLITDPAGFRVMDSEFHAIIWKAAGNPFLTRIAAGLYETGLEYRRIASEIRDVLPKSAQEHAEIVKALQARDKKWAEAATVDHLESILASTILALDISAGRSRNAS